MSFGQPLAVPALASIRRRDGSRSRASWTRSVATGLAATFLFAGCSASPVVGHQEESPGSGPPRALDPGQAVTLLLAVDDALAEADRGRGDGRLDALLGGPALQSERRLLAQRKSRGQLREETSRSRRLVRWRSDAGGGEGVLEIRAEVRLSSPGAAPASSAHIVRQWWARISWLAGGWRVEDDRDLPPGSWWR